MTSFDRVARLAEQMAETGSRLAKRAAIAEAIGRVAGDRSDAALEDAGRFAMYLAGLPFAEADPRKLNAGGALLSKAVLAVSGATQAGLTAAYRRHGDLGAAAFDLLAENRATGRAVAEAHISESRDGAPGFVAGTGDSEAGVALGAVAAAFAGMATAKTTAARAGLVEGLLGRASAMEAKYLLKLMLGDMRIGVKQSLVEEAIAVAAGVEVAAVRHAVMLEADLAGAVRRAFTGTLAAAHMRLFHPLGFMLASPVETPEEAVARFTEKPKKVAAEKKPKGRRKGRVADMAVDPSMEESEAFPDAAETDLVAASTGEAVSENPPIAMGPRGMGHPDGGGDAVAGGDAVGPPVEAFLEDKYDGMRAQVHCGDPEQPGRVAIYSRNREDITESFPELAEAFARVGETGVSGLILDGEILGWDFGQARALPFAVMGQRIGRKRVTNEVRRQIPVVFMAFDVMFAEGALRLEEPLRERRNRLETIAEELQGLVQSPLEGVGVMTGKGRSRGGAGAGQGALFLEGPHAQPEVGGHACQPGSSVGLDRLMLSPSRLVESAEDIDRAYAEARARANEGVMLKAAGSVYQPGRRGLAWVKLKRELATLDVVITGAEFGSGRRSQVLSDYTFAVRDAAGALVNVGKAYSGVTDAEIAELTEWLQAHTLEDYGHFRTVEPGIVLEVAFNNIMRSDRHASGFALRFPRILHIRRDKPVAEIDTVERVEAVYQSQVDKPAEVSGEE